MENKFNKYTVIPIFLSDLQSAISAGQKSRHAIPDSHPKNRLFLWLVLRLFLCHDFLLNFLWAVVIDLLLLQVQLVQVFPAVLGDVALTARLVVAQQQVEHGFHFGDVLGLHLD